MPYSLKTLVNDIIFVQIHKIYVIKTVFTLNFYNFYICKLHNITEVMIKT
ncbi:hypothetical protein FIS3754_40760 [Fischerella sp. NIES-3754]|nr:hypothetical protein FIS3754_40760 [Fischerella sp. NIES-3754]BCX10496.1 MAG: hypothetical protein KatS3mg066_4355 [Fischerella sp.]